MANKKIRLAIISQDPVNYGGVLRLVQYIYARSLAAGLAPSVIHYARFESHPELHASILNLVRGELSLAGMRKEYEFQGMHCIALGARLPEWEPNRLKATKSWKKTLEEFDAFILVTGSAHTGFPLAELRKPFVAWVSSTVEMDRRERLGQNHDIATTLEKASIKKIKDAEKQVLAAASRVFAVSDDTKRHVQVLTTQNVEVWPYPVDTALFQPSRHRTPTTQARFLFVGRANDPRKRIELFLEACNELRAAAPTLDFVATVVSSVFQSSEPLSFRLEHRNQLSDAELVSLYQASTAFVLTSEQEGLGIAAMEAMACGLPVISSRCGGPETFIVDSKTGFFVNDDPKAFAERMLRLANDEALRESLSSESRKRIEENFSERIWNSRFEEMLQKL